jgi:hypothetical protein
MRAMGATFTPGTTAEPWQPSMVDLRYWSMCSNVYRPPYPVVSIQEPRGETILGPSRPWPYPRRSSAIACSTAHRRRRGVAVVTGASSGIGLHTALGLARSGMRVVMTCRDRARTEKARRWITERSGSDRVDMALDF